MRSEQLGFASDEPAWNEAKEEKRRVNGMGDLRVLRSLWDRLAQRRF